MAGCDWRLARLGVALLLGASFVSASCSARRSSFPAPTAAPVARPEEPLPHGKFGPPIKAEPEDVTPQELALSDAPPPKDLADGAEIILVSGYEPSRNAGANVRVHIDRPGKKVILVLASYERVVWKVEASPNTVVSGIILSAYGKGSRVNTRLETTGYRVSLGYAYETGNRNFVEILRRLNERLGVNRIDSFYGKYSLPELVAIRELSRPDASLTLDGPAVREPTRDFDFVLYDRNRNPVRWSLTGPKDGAAGAGYPSGGLSPSLKLFAVSPNGQKTYLLERDGIRVRERTDNDSDQLVALPGNFPSFSWVMDMTYDSRHDIVAMISLGGEGFFYRFDATKNRWLDYRSANNIDIYSMAYDRETDQYYALTDRIEFLLIADDGNVTRKYALQGTLPGLERLYDRGNGPAPRLLIAPNGNDTAFIAVDAGKIRRIWHFDLATGQAELTYKDSARAERGMTPTR